MTREFETDCVCLGFEVRKTIIDELQKTQDQGIFVMPRKRYDEIERVKDIIKGIPIC